MKNMSYSGYTHAHFVQAHTSSERKFNTIIPSLGDTILIRIYTDARVF